MCVGGEGGRGGGGVGGVGGGHTFIRAGHPRMGGVFKGTGSICSRHTFIREGAPALRTGDGGLKEIFDDRSTLPTHPVPQTLMHNDYTVCTDC